MAGYSPRGHKELDTIELLTKKCNVAQFVVLFSVFGFLFFSGPYVLPLQIDGEEKLMKKRDQIHIQDECAMRPLLRLGTVLGAFY